MAASASRVYTISLTRQSISAAITLIQLKTGSSVPAEVLRAVVEQTSSVTSTMQSVQLNRKINTAATVTSFTPIPNGPVTDPAAAAAGATNGTGINASAEGIDGNVVRQGVFNFLNGWLFVPTPKEYIFVDASAGGSMQGILALKFPTAPSSTTFSADLVFQELG